MLTPGMFLVAFATAAPDTVPLALAAYSAETGTVDYAEADTLLTLHDTTPNDPYYTTGKLWALPKILAPAAWDIRTGSPEVVVAVIDTGTQYTHPDLAANIWVNTDEAPGNTEDDDGNGFVDDVYGYDFCNGDGNPWDGNGHGTRTAGGIGAAGNNGIGITGVAWSVKVMSIKLWSDSETADLADAVDCFNYAIMMRRRGVNVRVINTNRAVNPVGGIAMHSFRAAEAVYLPRVTDDDSDGMQDWWEYFYFGSTNTPSDGDADADLQDNISEFNAGTDPRDADSILAFTGIELRNAGSNLSVVINWSSVSNRWYSIEASDTVTNSPRWSAMIDASNIPGTGGILGFTGAVDRARRFFRVGTGL